MSLQHAVFNSGLYLAMRQGLGILISVGGTFLLSRLIGPGNFGIYSASSSFEFYLFLVASLGISPFLIRLQSENSQKTLHCGFTILFFSSIICIAASVFSAPYIANLAHLPPLRQVFPVLVAVLPISFYNEITYSIIQKKLDFKIIAFSELAGQTGFYLVALPCALCKAGYWAPVAGWWAHEVIVCIFGIVQTRYVPRLYFDQAEMIAMLRYGSTYAASNSAGMLCPAIAPLLIGRFAGAGVVGCYSLTNRIVESLGFVREVVRKLSMAVFARLSQGESQVSHAVTKGMQYQLLTIGTPLVLFSAIVVWFVPHVLGNAWLPIVELYPFLALFYCFASVFQLHSTVLNLLGHNMKTAIFTSFQALVIIGAAAFFLNWNRTIIGYGYGLLCGIPSFIVLDFFYARYNARPKYGLLVFWSICISIALFAPNVSRWLYCALIFPFLFKKSRITITNNIREIIRC